VTFRWRYLDAAGAPADGPAETFEDQQQAETWFGDVWPDLRAGGVDAVELLDGEDVVYGPMSLHEA
jgi:hypothetical protein